MTTQPTTICLSMIVKNEAKVIARCLASVRPIISSWIVVDTGSTDGTQELVREVLRGIPGELHERPWKDFATNRNEALALAKDKAEYILVVDADDLLVVPPGFVMPLLTAEAYALLIEYNVTRYWRTQLFRTDRDFRYVGVLHEVVVGGSGQMATRLEGLTYRISNDGARSQDPDKYRKDAQLLSAALQKDPTNARYAFYLAQSFRDAGENEHALAAYEVRVAMGGWVEEVWFSLYEVAKLTMRLERSQAEVIAAYLRAYEYRPSRAEALYQLAAYLRGKGRPGAAYPFAKIAAETPRSQDVLFIDEPVYTWCALDELAVAAYWTEHYDEVVAAGEKLLSGGVLPEAHRARVQKNVELAREKLRR